MSYKRSAIRREQREREKIFKDKSKNGKLRRAEKLGNDLGKIIPIAKTMEVLYSKFNWSKEELVELSQKLFEQVSKSGTEVFQYALQVWQEKMEIAILASNNGEPLRTSANTIEDSILLQNRNANYIFYSSAILLELYSDYNMYKKLDIIIDELALLFNDMSKEPTKHTISKYSNELKEIVGLEIV